MKHLLNGVAIAAALAIAGPAWAQQQQQYNPATPGAQGVGAPMPSSSATMPPHHAVRHTHAMHSFHKGMSSKAHAAGDTTAALNRQELSRINAGQPPMPPTAPMGEGPPGSPQPAPSH